MIFEYTDYVRPISSWISGVYYNEISRELLVNAHGKSYIYLDVPADVFNDFEANYSAGDTYNAFVRGRFETKFGKGRDDITLRQLVLKKEVPVEGHRVFKVRAIVPFEAEVSAASLDEAVKVFLESNKDVPGIEIKEVVVPFGE